jgi:hypothetical protein
MTGMLAGGTVNRITWRPGTDRLLGTCHCGAMGEAEDPVAMWEWLLAHPEHPGRPDRRGHSEHSDRPDRPERPGHPEHSECP